MSETGRAAVFTGAGQPFEIREFPVAEPGERDVVVQVEHTNVCGSDLHMWKGDTDLAKMGLTYGMVLGHEMVGVVHARGAKVRTDAAGAPLKDGDRVAFTYYLPCGRCRTCLRGKLHACMGSIASLLRPVDKAPHFIGGFADYYYVKGRQKVFKVPDGLSADAAAGANCALSQVIHGFDVVGLSLGDHVVVQGAGGLGIMACAVAKELGAGRVIAIDGVSSRLELARSFGADEVIDLNALPDPRQRVRQVLSLTDNEGADVVVEVAGLPDVVPEGIRMLARGGAIWRSATSPRAPRTRRTPPCWWASTDPSTGCRCIPRTCCGGRWPSWSAPRSATPTSAWRRTSSPSTRSTRPSPRAPAGPPPARR